MEVKKNHIILSIRDTGIYYNSEDRIDWDKTNFPDKQYFGISRSTECYWLVQMKQYHKPTGELIVEVENYEAVDSTDFKKQQPKAPIHFLLFENIDWNQLKGIFNHYQTIKFKEIGNNFLSDNDHSKEEDVLLESDDVGILKFSFKQSLSKFTFKMGYVETVQYLKGVSKKAVIKIHNPHIIPEFEFVKPYFAKLFGGRKLTVRGVVTNKNDASTYLFRSPEISSIDQDFITGIKRLEINRKIKKPKIIAVDKSLFTPEEFFDGFEGEKGNKIRQSDQELLKEILEARGVRNAKQLQYISGSLQSPKDRIHFTVTPQFGFLFYVAGEEMHHYIWELLDSNATYIWSGSKDLPKSEILQTITQKINFIRDHGRVKYLSHEDNSEIIFSKVNHESVGSKLVDGFPKWRKRLDEKLV